MLLPTDNPVSKALYCMERMLARSATLQAAFGVSSVADCKNKIDYKEAEGDEPRPVCCVSLAEPCQFSLVAGGDQNFLRPRGTVWIYLAADVPDQYITDKKSELMWAANLFGGVLQEVAALAGADQTFDTDVTESELALTSWNLLDFSEVPTEMQPTLGRFWWGVYEAKWGDE